MRRVTVFAVFIRLVGLATGIAARLPVQAARDIEAGAATGSGLELVVFEAPGCIYCRIFRRDVLPAYSASPRAREVPLRFVDVNEIDRNRLGLAEPISSVPTFVLMRGGREEGRIAGYTGPESFFHLVGHLIGRAQ
jgi:thioredoxin-related protein